VGLQIHQDGSLKHRGAPHLTAAMLNSCNQPHLSTDDSEPLALKLAIIRGQPERIGIWTKQLHTVYPAKALMATGLGVPRELQMTPLTDWYHRQWELSFKPSNAPKPKATSIWQEFYGNAPPPEGARVPARFR
jgi:hypothetical protein